MARKNPIVVDDVEPITQPFDLDGWIAREDAAHPGFAAEVEAELAELRLQDRLRALRRERKLSQAQLARRMGVSQSAVAQMETAEPGRMEVRTLAKVATALGYRLQLTFDRAHPLPAGMTVRAAKGQPLEVESTDGTITRVPTRPRARARKATRRRIGR